MLARLGARAPWPWVAAALALTGCGFELRGETNLPDDVKHVYVQASRELAADMEIYLGGGGASLADSQEAADLLVEVHQEEFARRLLSVDPDTGKEREFELVLTVRYDAQRRDGPLLVDDREVKLRRSFDFDPEAVVGSEREEEVIRIEMRRGAAELIVSQLETALR